MATVESTDFKPVPGEHLNQLELGRLAMPTAEVAPEQPRLFNPAVLNSLILLRQRDKTSGGRLPEDHTDFPGETFKVLPHYMNSYDPLVFGAWTISIGQDSYRIWSLPSTHGVVEKCTKRVSKGKYRDAEPEEKEKVFSLLEFWNNNLDLGHDETAARAQRRSRAGSILVALRKFRSQ